MKQGPQQQRYRVLERLAAGGMAEVFLAESAGIEGFKKRVAIKRVLPQLSEKKRFIAMFLDEARLSAHLTHSNVAQVFDIGVGDNAYFIVMEYVDGSDLKAVVEFAKNAKRQLPVEVIVHIAEKICEGLSYAHEAKGSEGQPLHIVHRDVSPANVLITKYGEIKIVDFGLAKATSQLEKSEPGIVKGKFGYLSPEATNGVEVDARADVFAVGIILWEMLAQRRLFLGDNDLQTVLRVREAVIPPLAPLNKDVSADLEKIIQKALAKDPEKRFQTAREMGRALNTYLFKYGKPVGANDVADLVHGTVALRKTGDKEKDTTLSRLIEEALLEFKSLDNEQQSARAEAAKANLAKGVASDEPRGRVSSFEDIGKWAEEVESVPTSGGPKSIQTGPTDTKPTSEPAETIKATPIAKAEESKAEALPKNAEKEKAGEAASEKHAESLPADTIKSAAESEGKPSGTSSKSRREKSKESDPAATMRETPKAKKKKNLGKLQKVEVRVPRREEPGVRGKTPEAQSGNVIWLYVAAAVLLLAASAYYSGLIGH